MNAAGIIRQYAQDEQLRAVKGRPGYRAHSVAARHLDKLATELERLAERERRNKARQRQGKSLDASGDLPFNLLDGDGRAEWTTVSRSENRFTLRRVE